jgi:hypothetical protein
MRDDLQTASLCDTLPSKKAINIEKLRIFKKKTIIFCRFLQIFLIFRHQDLNVKRFAKSPDVIGNAINQNAQNRNASLFVRILAAIHKLNVANAPWVSLGFHQIYQFSRKLKEIPHAALVEINKK